MYLDNFSSFCLLLLAISVHPSIYGFWLLIWYFQAFLLWSSRIISHSLLKLNTIFIDNWRNVLMTHIMVTTCHSTSFEQFCVLQWHKTSLICEKLYIFHIHDDVFHKVLKYINLTLLDYYKFQYKITFVKDYIFQLNVSESLW